VAFDAGRQAVRDAMELNWQAGKPTPLEYQLLNPLIWSTRFSLQTESTPAVTTTAFMRDDATKLFEHPAFAGWFWQDPALAEAALGLGKQFSPDERRASVTRLAHSRFTPEVVACYQRRLRSMSRWLALASQPEMAARAWTVADHLANCEPAESPFVRRLIQIGLDVALINLRLKNLI
jgi:hypothetical protein